MNEWKLSSADCKKAQLLLSKEWVERNIFKITEITQSSVERLNTNEIENINEEEEEEKQQDIEANENIEKAPPLLYLKNEEKFKDCDENIIEIETRGEKNRNKIYFKVKDIMTGFEMSNLDTTISHKKYGYEKNIHYKIFFVKNKNNTIIKSLYLTYYGFLKIILISRTMSSFFLKNINILTKWLDNLINNKYYNNYILEKVSNDLSGVVYICSSPLVNAVKIGYWTGNITSLQSRYKMIYGKDVFLICKNVENAHDIEKQIHTEFKQFNISGELFQKDNIQLYIDYFNDYIIEYENSNNEFRQEYNSINKMKFIEEKEIEKNNIIRTLEMKIRTLEMSHANDLLEKDLIIQKITHENATLKTQIETNEIIYNLKLQLSSK
jgi:hypothetical protein